MAAQLQGISDRQCRRLLLRYRESGPPGMANRRREKPSNNQLPDGLAQYALSIIRERYTDFGPTLACEKLAELHDVHLSKEIVRSLMDKAGRWLPRKQRAPKIQQPRYRRACCGELIQIAIAWAISKGTVPIIGATRVKHISEAVGSLNITLSTDEIATLERLAAETGVDTRGAWEERMDTTA
ncbi:hypothetical protein BKN43_11150 [Klebsiella quasipneumoniae]|nr:hypothetical protein [Klebsiella quasipneumoniae]PII45754.1 hypothetical protein BKN43_11150 [Klebsiella quasipneumoniae]